VVFVDEGDGICRIERVIRNTAERVTVNHRIRQPVGSK
jgi:hypothetical protein